MTKCDVSVFSTDSRDYTSLDLKSQTTQDGNGLTIQNVSRVQTVFCIEMN
jgi:hypothetical protein